MTTGDSAATAIGADEWLPWPGEGGTPDFELTDAEAEAVTIAVYEWLQGHHIDLLEFRG